MDEDTLNVANIICLFCARYTGRHVKDKKKIYKVLGHTKFSVYLLKYDMLTLKNLMIKYEFKGRHI